VPTMNATELMSACAALPAPESTSAYDSSYWAVASNTYAAVPFTAQQDQRAFCSSCVVSTTGVLVDGQFVHGSDQLQRLRSGDWATIVIVVILAGVLVGGEYRDIELVHLSEQRATLAAREAGQTEGAAWRCVASCAFGLQSVVRKYATLPWLTVAIPYLLTLRGADALNTCFNAIALFFIIEIDNSMYDNALDYRTRAAFVAAGHLEISASVSRRLQRAKTVYSLIVPVQCIFLLLCFRRGVTIEFDICLFSSGPVTNTTIALMEYAVDHRNAKRLAFDVIAVIAKSIIGIALIFATILWQIEYWLWL